MSRLQYVVSITLGLLLLLIAGLERAGGVQELDKNQDIAANFLKALKNKDLDAAVRLAGVPWLTEDRKVIKDEQELRKHLEELIQKTNVGKYNLEVVHSLAYQEARKEVKKDADQKLLDEVMDKDDRVILFKSENPPAKRYMLVKKQQGGLKVVGGPFKLTFLVMQNKMPDDLWKFVEEVTDVELLSLSGKQQKDAPHFQGWHILGKTIIKDAETRKKLVGAFKLSVEENDGTHSQEFKPTYGLHFSGQGQVLNFVICFHCSQMKVYTDKKKLGDALLTASPQPLFDEILVRAGVPLPGKKEN